MTKTLDGKPDSLPAPTWPVYENVPDRGIMIGDIAEGVTFDIEGRDTLHKGEIVSVTTEWIGLSYRQWVTIEEANGNDYDCDADAIYLIETQDGKRVEELEDRTLEDRTDA